MIPENQHDIIMNALITASFDPRFSFYHMTVHDVKSLADIMEEIMGENGFRIFQSREFVNYKKTCQETT